MERTSPLILTTKTGQSFKKRYFARLWDEATTEGGLAIGHAARLRAAGRCISTICAAPP